MITIVLIRPRLSGNLGAIARVMKNFGVLDLILIEPVCNKNSKTAKNRAKWANDVLSKAKIRTWKVLDSFDTIIATSGKTGSDYNINRTPMSPEKSALRVRGKTAIIFGPEDRGLTNNELALADFLVIIPTNPNYPILNLSQSVGIILYELSRQGVVGIQKEKTTMMGAVEKKILEKEIDKTIKLMKFPTTDKGVTQKKVWKRVLGKASVTKRESFALIGFFKRLINNISKK